VHWHPFQLDPQADETPVPLRQAYAAKFGSAERTEQILSQTQSTAQAEGLPMDFGRGQVRVTTLPAHRLMWLAGREGVQAAVAEALFRAHFAEGLNLADPQVLLQVGVAGGLAEARIRELLATDQGEAEVAAGIAEARALGINSVPTFVINGRHALQGAQPPEVLAQVLREIAAEQAAQTAADNESAGAADGCRL
jgi:predicted DsbA family dithiol-disulfide isomerase